MQPARRAPDVLGVSRWQGAAQAVLRLWSGMPENGRRLQAGRLASAQFALATLFLLFSLPSLHTERADAVLVTAGLAAVTSLVLAVLPWQRWPHRATLLPVVWAFLLMGGLLGGVAGVLDETVIFFGMAFVYVGLTQPPRSALALAPLAVLTALPQLRQGGGAVVLLSTVTVCVLLGELLSSFVAARRHERAQLAALLQTTRQLSAATTRTQVVDVLVGAATGLLGAAGLVLLPPDRVLAGTGTRLVGPDTAEQPDAGLRRRAGVPSDAATVLVLPLPGRQGPAAVAVLWWQAALRDHDAYTGDVVEAVATQAGQVLERLVATQTLHDAAVTDPLTGLANRRRFLTELESSRPGDALVLVDLDHFKRLNDTHGHQHGDDVLRRFGAVLAATVRADDCAARYGGEEFVLLLPAAGAAGAARVVAELRDRWAQVCPEVTFSAGITDHRSGRAVTATLAAADAALYAAKDAGRDCSVLDAELSLPAQRAAPER